MLNKSYGIRFKHVPLPKKTIDRRRVFYTAVIKFGAALANADGSADASELMELKRFFDIDNASIQDAARLFNEELMARSTIATLLGEFSEVFRDAVELKESFIVGMCSVSLADGVIHSREIALLQEAARILELGQDSISRAFLAAGFDFEAFSQETGDTSGPRNTAFRNRTEMNLKVLGLTPGCSVGEIKAAYRELAKRYHPDRIRSQGFPETEIAKMEAILIKVNLAYGELMKESSENG